MNEVIGLGIALAALVAGSITDLKTREVPDWLNYGLIFTGVGLGVLSSIIFSDISYLFRSLTGLVFFFLIGALLFYTGQWGGGDTKMIMGLGSIIGLNIPWPIPSNIQETPFMIIFIGATLVSGAIYGLIWTCALSIKRRKECIEGIKKKLSTREAVRTKYICLGSMLILLIAFFLINEFYTRISVIILAIVIPLIFYLSIIIKVTEKVCMIKDVSPKKLTEGEWIEEEIMEDKKLIFKKGRILSEKDIEKIKDISKHYYIKIRRNYLGLWFTKNLHLTEVKEGDFLLQKPAFINVKGLHLNKREAKKLNRIGGYKFSSAKIRRNSLFQSIREFDEESLKAGDELLDNLYFGDYISGPKDLGISKENIEKLIEYMKRGKIKKVTIREGIPFVPSFLIAFILTLILLNHGMI